MTMNFNCISEFSDFFNKNSKSISTILDAYGCRENWLQGEIYRWFKFKKSLAKFSINDTIVPEGKIKFDFVVKTRIPAVGELKVLGGNYNTKVITGGALRPALNHLVLPLTKKDRHLNIGQWGLIHDFFKLYDFSKKVKCEAYLVLLADISQQDNSSSLSNVLDKINFIKESTNLPLLRGRVRMWQIATV